MINSSPYSKGEPSQENVDHTVDVDPKALGMTLPPGEVFALHMKIDSGSEWRKPNAGRSLIFVR